MPEPDIAALVPDRAQTDEHLAEERATTDETIRNRDGDPAVLEPERAETDASLDAERERADETIDRVRERLAEERAAHVATKAALSSRDDFLAIVSHDLRNPLSIITLNAAVLRRCDPTADPAQVARLGERIDRAATAMMRLVNDLLDMARIEEGRLQLQRASHDVSALVLELVDTHRPLAATKGITLETDVAPALAADVDAHRLTQALANVLDNALKFSPQGGRIVVAASHASPDLRIAIRDEGPGIPPEQQGEVFERLSQLQNENRSGLGLGLYISRSIVEAHGGRMTVESVPGHGATIVVTLPGR